LNNLDRFPKSTQVLNPTKTNPVVQICSMLTDGRTGGDTGMTKHVVVSHKF